MNNRYLKYPTILEFLKNFHLIVLFFSFFILFGALGYTVVNTYDQTQQKNIQLDAIKNDVQKEKIKNSQLVALNNTVNSSEYVEDNARSKLGLSYPNEQIYIINHSNPSSTIKNTEPVLPTSTVDNKTNLQKWLEVIFGH